MSVDSTPTSATGHQATSPLAIKGCVNDACLASLCGYAVVPPARRRACVLVFSPMAGSDKPYPNRRGRAAFREEAMAEPTCRKSRRRARTGSPETLGRREPCASSSARPGMRRRPTPFKGFSHPVGYPPDGMGSDRFGHLGEQASPSGFATDPGLPNLEGSSHGLYHSSIHFLLFVVLPDHLLSPPFPRPDRADRARKLFVLRLGEPNLGRC